MHCLKFDNFSIDVADYLLDRNWLTFDMKFSNKEDFNKFTELHQVSQPLEYKVDESSYCGYFGAFIFDVDYNVRLYMTTDMQHPAKVDKGNAFQYNLPHVIQNHEKRINILIEILTQKNLLSENDLEKLSSYLPVTDYKIFMHHQVPNLSDYLKASCSTMEDLRCESLQ